MHWAPLAFLAAITNAVYLLLYSYIIRDRFSDLDSINLIINFSVVMAIIGSVLYITKKDTKIVLLDKSIMNFKFILLSI